MRCAMERARTCTGTPRYKAFRVARPSHGLARTVRRSVITTYGDTYATTNMEFVREGSNKVGRQSRTWARMPDGWRIVAAHVSVIDPPENE
jgi:hypothetical protein